ncbi:Succinate dehydrogenase assembly factor 3, mitochondrial [Orchesella cincta]|uniref:Succinate dehydrogenase assembly factor 3 n=1 Tax=Orchesella cincta TaxID=48709 RepID=A0A1D2MFM1_ORCCI|nr:Succinate dehydrogenase assembly factor 3, mitochondrial [Orchesella cincta]
MHQQNVRVLYKTILRLHRALPPEVRELGDQYVKDEFRRHKGVGKEHVAPFMMEWANYCGMLAQQLGLRGPKTASSKIGIGLEEAQLDLFDGQQIHQLYELRQSISPINEIDNSRSNSTRDSKGS